MRKAQTESILANLHAGNVRYLVAGGLAVVAHGYVRYTADIDLILAMDNPNLINAVEILERFGYYPLAPVKLRDLADEAKRRDWIEGKNAMVLNLVGPKTNDVRVDIFLQHPFDFEAELAKAKYFPLD